MVLHEPDMFDIYSRSQRGGPQMPNDLMMPRDIMRKPVMPKPAPMAPITISPPRPFEGSRPNPMVPPVMQPPTMPSFGLPGMEPTQKKQQFGILDNILDQPNRRQPFRM